MSKAEEPSNETRFDPFLREWVIIAPNRSVRPVPENSTLTAVQASPAKSSIPTVTPTSTPSSNSELGPLAAGMSKEEIEKEIKGCPFCEGKSEPLEAIKQGQNWPVIQLSNKFASLKENSPSFRPEAFEEIYKRGSPFGKCEVIIYSPNHFKSFGQLDLSDIEILIRKWMERFKVLQNFPNKENKPDLKYTFIFENRGKEIGNSRLHPHGQIYSFPYLPPRIERELKSINDYRQETNKCMWCDVLNVEHKYKERIIDQVGDFTSFIPYFAHWPYEMWVMPKRHFPNINYLSDQDIKDLAKILKISASRYDKLRTGSGLMPYILAMHNSPINPELDQWHFHIEIYTPFRGVDAKGNELWKFLAGVESGTNTFINDSNPENNAKAMRDLPVKMD